MIHVYKYWYSLFFTLFVLFSCYFFINDWLNHISRLSKNSNLFFFYLSMPVDNATWHATVGMFYTLKPLLKSKSSTRNFSEFFSLRFFFAITLLHLNNIHLFFSCRLTKKTTYYLRLLTKLPKMAKITIFISLPSKFTFSLW